MSPHCCKLQKGHDWHACSESVPSIVIHQQPEGFCAPSSFSVSSCKPWENCFLGDEVRASPSNFLLCPVCSLPLLKVKVWFQNRRMKWKRVKGGQQGAAAREKELVNVKKGTLLPSELSGIGAATLQQTGDSLANDDSHDSDHSSEHAHL